jgi:hypothetical protein
MFLSRLAFSNSLASRLVLVSNNFACGGMRNMSQPALEIYEFRILNSAGTIISATQEVHITDNQAVRSARHVAAGRPFEVWAGIKCLYPVAPTSAQRADDL